MQERLAAKQRAAAATQERIQRGYHPSADDKRMAWDAQRALMATRELLHSEEEQAAAAWDAQWHAGVGQVQQQQPDAEVDMQRPWLHPNALCSDDPNAVRGATGAHAAARDIQAGVSATTTCTASLSAARGSAAAGNGGGIRQPAGH